MIGLVATAVGLPLESKKTLPVTLTAGGSCESWCSGHTTQWSTKCKCV